jgi:hypothetical protein
MDRQQEFLGRLPTELLLPACATERWVARLALRPPQGSVRAESTSGMDVVDEQSDQSFPASDPPPFSGLSL